MIRLSLLFLLSLSLGCSSTGPGQGVGIVPYGTIYNADGDAVADVRTDGNVTVVRAHARFVGGVRGALTGFPLLGPVDVSEGLTLVSRREPRFEESYEAGAPLPAWVASSPVFLPGEAEALGYTFAWEGPGDVVP